MLLGVEKEKRLANISYVKKHQKIFQQWENLKANWMMIKSVQIKTYFINQLDKIKQCCTNEEIK